MIAAFVDGTLARAKHGLTATCPECKGKLYPRLPDHTVPHWAHNPLPDGQTRDCSRDAGEMSEWHRAWQDTRADLECIEVAGDTVDANGHQIFADVKNAAGTVIEFQRSRIGDDEIQRREKYWRKGIWVVDGLPSEDGEERVRLERLPDDTQDDYWRFRWPRMPRLIYAATWPVWIDVGERGMLQKKFAENGRGGGWLVTREWFITEIVNGAKMVLHNHLARSDSTRIRAKTVARTTVSEQHDLAEMPVNCIRPIPDEPCCGKHHTGIQGEPIILSCMLCPNSPTYWRLSHDHPTA